LWEYPRIIPSKSRLVNNLREISGYEIISSNPLKYPRNKQGLSCAEVGSSLPLRMVAVVIQGQLLKKN
jgi:hypothetical protein